MAKTRGAAAAASAFVLALAGVAGLAVGSRTDASAQVASARLSSQLVRAAVDLSDARLHQFKASFDPAAARLASRHDPKAHPELWGRPAAWASYDVSRAPNLGLAVMSPEDAQRLNSYLPGSGAPPAKPFILKTRSDAERARALRCLTQAVYFEAALEPLEGQRAVAQVVLNRVKHPEYPNSVCGVVFQGWERWTGCQFSFTCDGSLLRGAVPVYWRQAEAVARSALEGYVEQRVGTATHYHADYVVPYWRSSLTKVGQIGRHIFYRWPGRPGLPGAFTSRYEGRGELRLSDLVLAGRASRPTPPPGLIPLDPTLPTIPGITTDTIVVADASVPGGETTRVRSIIAGRRQPTPEDIARINEVLARGPEAETPAPAPAAKPVALAQSLPLTQKKPAVAEPMPVTEINKPAAAAEPAATN